MRMRLASAVLVSVGLSVSVAHATNGYFAYGYGTKNKGMAGAGVALPQDSLAAAVNPAGTLHVGDRVDAGASIFSPPREYTENASSALMGGPPLPGSRAGGLADGRPLFGAGTRPGQAARTCSPKRPGSRHL